MNNAANTNTRHTMDVCNHLGTLSFTKTTATIESENVSPKMFREVQNILSDFAVKLTSEWVVDYDANGFVVFATASVSW